MNKLFRLLLLVTIAGAAASHPVLAQGFSIKKNALPDGSQIERSRLRMQIVDPSPIVTDVRKPEDNTTYEINIPPMKKATNRVVRIGDGGDGSGQSSVPIRSNGLPNATFNSNIPPAGVGPNRALPPGTSTNGLGAVAGKKMPGLSSQKPSAPLTAVQPPAGQTIKMYEPTSPSAATVSVRTREHVQAKKIERGALVGK